MRSTVSGYRAAVGNGTLTDSYRMASGGKSDPNPSDLLGGEFECHRGSRDAKEHLHLCHLWLCCAQTDAYVYYQAALG
jgi:hypothetical protein